MLGDRAWRGDAAPIVDHRFLNPLQIDGVVDMTHVVDVGRFDRYWVPEHRLKCLVPGARTLPLADKRVNKIKVPG